MATYVRELVPALARADTSLDITLFHSRVERSPEEPWAASFPMVELDSPIRRLYPRWALLRRPALPSSLAAHEVIHSPLPAAVPPTGAGQRLVVTVHDVAFLIHPEAYPRQW